MISLMALKKLILFAFIWIFGLTHSQRMTCGLFKPGGQYKGLLVYRYARNWNQKEYRMSNKDNYYWRLDIEGKGSDPKNWFINRTSSRLIRSPSERQYLQRFGIRVWVTDVKNLKSWVSYDCKLETPSLKINCYIYSKDTTSDNFTYPETAFPRNSVILKPWPTKYNEDDKGHYVFVINKENRNEYWAFDPVSSFKNVPEARKCQDSYSDCLKPKFIDQMDSNLFKKIESIMDYDYNDGSGHLLIFTIDERPFYCFTVNNADLSEQCKSEKNLLPLYPHCFPPKKVKEFDWEEFLTIFFSIVIIILLLAIVYVLYCTRCWEGSRKRMISTIDDESTAKTKKSISSKAKTSRSRKSRHK